jgi:hypothetical protein
VLVAELTIAVAFVRCQDAAPVRLPASAKDLERVAALLHRQDDCILTHRADLAKEDFEASFVSPDLHCESGQELLDRWDDFLHAHRDAKLESVVVRADRVAEWLVAQVRRPFTGVALATEQPVHDESVETIVLHDVGGRLRIAAIYETAAAKAPRLDRERRSYDAHAELCYAVDWPEPFVPVTREGMGAALDELMLLDPADEARMGVVVFDPTIDQPLEELLWQDLADPGAKVTLEPRRFEKAPDGFPSAYCAESRCEPTAKSKDAKDPKDSSPNSPHGVAMAERDVYLSPDDRIVFAFYLTAPADRLAALAPKLDAFARSARLVGVKAPQSYAAAVLAANPRWNTLGAGVFKVAPVELTIPRGLAATPLLGDRILRLRLRILEDPRSSLVVRVFPTGKNRIAAKDILEMSVKRMESFACAEGRGGDSHRSEGFMDVLGQKGDWRSVEIQCQNGSRRAYQIVAADRDDCHVQVQVLPGSDKVDVQSSYLKKVLDGLRVGPGNAGGSSK